MRNSKFIEFSTETIIERAKYNGALCSIYFYVYSYSDPLTDVVVYIGKGTGYRAWSHLNRSSNRRLNNLIRLRGKQGFEILPTIHGFFESSDEALSQEAKLIEIHGRKDLETGTLFNLTDGGEGALGHVTDEPIEFRGITYPNIAHLTRSFGIKYDNYRRRIGLGWTMEEALEIREKANKVAAKEIAIGDRRWPSISAFSSDTRFSESQVRSLTAWGLTYEEILNRDRGRDRSGTTITCHGETYPSKAYFARKVDKSVKAVDYWLSTGWSAEEIFDDQILNRSSIYVDWRGQLLTQTEFSNVANISLSSLIKYKKKGLSYEEIFRLGHRELGSKLGGKPIVFKGHIYPSFTAFNIQYLGVAKSTLSKWINQFGLNAEQCIEIYELAREISYCWPCSFKGCLSHASEIVRGKMPRLEINGFFYSKTTLRNKCRISYEQLNKLLKYGMSAEEIFLWSEQNRGDPPTIEPFQFNGILFRSYSELDRHLGLKTGYVGAWRRRGFSFDDIEQLLIYYETFLKTGRSHRDALQLASYKLTQEKSGGKKLKPNVRKYIEYRVIGYDPKRSAELSGVSRSNTSRLEKTHHNLINEAKSSAKNKLDIDGKH